MIPDITDYAVGIVLLVLRAYLIYLLTIGWYYIRQGKNMLWLYLYTLGTFTYLVYTSISTLGIDSVYPIRIAGVAGLTLCVQVLVKTLKHTFTQKGE